MARIGVQINQNTQGDDLLGFDEDFGDFDLPLGISRVEEDDDRPATEEEMEELLASFEYDEIQSINKS